MTRRKSLWLQAGKAIGTVGVMFAAIQVPSYADTNNLTAAFPMPQPPSVMAGSVLLMNADSGQVIYAKDADEERAPASTTKLMTMYLLEKALSEGKINLQDSVPVTPDAYKVATQAQISNAYLDPREHFTVEDMLKFIAVISANDATVAIADKLAGDQQAFVADMNAEAKTLHLTHTHYMNADGLQEANHYMSARDLATLAHDLVSTYPQVLQYTALPRVTVRKGQTWPSTDELVGNYPGVDGLKTGYTSDAGYCYVGTAKQNGVRLITVVMADTTNNIHQRFRDAVKLFDYGFHDFSETTVAKKGDVLGQTVTVKNGSQEQLSVSPASDLLVELPQGIKGAVSVRANVLSAPISQGQTVGTLNYIVNGLTVNSVPLVATKADHSAGFFTRLFRSIAHWFGHLFHH